MEKSGKKKKSPEVQQIPRGGFGFLQLPGRRFPRKFNQELEREQGRHSPEAWLCFVQNPETLKKARNLPLF